MTNKKLFTPLTIAGFLLLAAFTLNSCGGDKTEVKTTTDSTTVKVDTTKMDTTIKFTDSAETRPIKTPDKVSQ